MARYDFQTTWRLGFDIQRVWHVLSDPEHYGRWWPSFVGYRCLTPGVRGVGMRDEQAVRGPLPYTLQFCTTVVDVDPPRLVRYRAEGGLCGQGQVTLELDAERTTVKIDWSVRTTGRWVNLLAPLIRPLLVWNHRRVMSLGRRGLERYLTAQDGRSP